jgi:hypothetical protein
LFPQTRCYFEVQSNAPTLPVWLHIREYLYRWLRISLVASGTNSYTYAWHHSIAYASAIAFTYTNASTI